MVLPVVGEVDMLAVLQVLPLFPDLNNKFHRNMYKVIITGKYNYSGQRGSYARLRARLEALEVKSDELQLRSL